MKKVFCTVISLLLIFNLPLQTWAKYSACNFTSTRSEVVTVYFDYNDSWASMPSTAFSRNLARMAVSLSAAAYDKESTAVALENMGYEVVAQRNFERTATAEDHDFVAWTLGKKSVMEKGEEKNQYILAIRGTDENGEWYGNFDVGYGKEHYGFKTAGEELMLELGMYITTPADSNRILVTGHSRGAAVTNLVAQWMTDDEHYATKNHIYGYTFATPATTMEPINNGNIFNFVNGGDIVTNMPLSAWGYGRNGQTITLAYDEGTIQRLNAGLRSVTGEDYSAGFDSGEFNKIFTRLAPTISDFYQKNSNGYSVSGLFNDMVPILSGDFSTADLTSVALQAASLNAADALQYFIGETSKIVQAHAPETYIAWVNAMYV